MSELFNSSLGYLVTGPERQVVATLSDVQIKQEVGHMGWGYVGKVGLTWSGKLLGVRAQDLYELLGLKVQLLIIAAEPSFKYKSVLLEKCYVKSYNKLVDDVTILGCAVPDETDHLASYFDYVLSITESDLLPVVPSALALTTMPSPSGCIVIPAVAGPRIVGVSVLPSTLYKKFSEQSAEDEVKANLYKQFSDYVKSEPIIPVPPQKEKPKQQIILLNVKREVNFDE